LGQRLSAKRSQCLVEHRNPGPQARAQKTALP
jgi:hypothetical protein